MLIAALLIGLLIVAQCVVGLLASSLFVGLVGAMQGASLIHFAALVRLVFGVVLYLAAPASRAPICLRLVGAAIAVGGLLTPFIGAQFASVVLGWWSEGGAPLVRVWAAAGLALGAFIGHAAAPRRRAPDPSAEREALPRK
jgi:hypothetical protein